ncbi:MAG: zinc-binding dehydrogenase [Actinomycetales bacterium]
MPDAVSIQAAASLGCRFATAYRAVTKVGRVQAGERILVVGCGGVGLSILMIAVALGAEVMAVDVSAPALELAESLGAVAVPGVDGEANLADLVGDGVDVSFDAVGSIAACRMAVQSLRPRGRHVQVGLLPAAEIGDRATVPMHRVIGQELAILGSHGMAAADYPELVDLVGRGILDPMRLVTRVLSLDEVPSALADMNRAAHPGITLIEPSAIP